VWADHFSEVTGVDPSSKMLDAAKEQLPQEKRESVNYVHTPAEELSFLPDNSVDMVTAGAYHVVSSAKHLQIVRYHSTIVPLVRIPQSLERGFEGVEATRDRRILGE
jgi:2-polyprenyl-3-methyl-5-hydroxy-6-metoxy-1,4-benzoquinol methylase